MADRHKNPAIPFRPDPEGDGKRLRDLAKRTGRTIDAVLCDALAAYLDEMDNARLDGLDKIRRDGHHRN